MALVYQLTDAKKPDSTSNKIESSWLTIFELSYGVRMFIKQSQWEKALELNNRREAKLDQHFQEFPIGPSTQFFYQDRLSQFFSLQRELKNLLSKRQGRHLTLVR